MSNRQIVYADADDPGLRFILPSLRRGEEGGLAREKNNGHFGTIVGRGGSGKSVLALQLVTALLEREDKTKTVRGGGRSKVLAERSVDCRQAAFYFTLEASPAELKRQLLQFEWGQKRYKGWEKERKEESKRVSSNDDEYWNGLYLVAIPSPAESLNAVNLQIRQTIGKQLEHVDDLVAIVIDPMGAINVGNDLRADLSQLKELSETHGTFLFLLTEKHAFEQHTSIEHYSQSIVHLEYDPGQKQHRRLYVQKARGQSFRSGYHHLDLQQARMGGVVRTEDLSKGVLVYPSIEAQSAYAHRLLSETSPEEPRRPAVSFFPDEDPKDSANRHRECTEFLAGREKIEAGSAVFLMGPPGAFKEHIASLFAMASVEHEAGATIYLSFKADLESIKSHARRAGVRLLPKPFDSRTSVPDLKNLEGRTYFFDARNPLLTPEEILFTVQQAINGRTDRKHRRRRVAIRRAVVWGLRRLYDFPNFRDRVVQFLEALVTLLKSHQITCLLVDWPDPDKEKASAVPILDLCQYIFLTRVCKTAEWPDVSGELQNRLDYFWHLKDEKGRRRKTKARQIALLRAQRTRHGVHHDRGAVFVQSKEGKIERLDGTGTGDDPKVEENFEYRWLQYGDKWEQDTSLLS